MGDLKTYLRTHLQRTNPRVPFEQDELEAAYRNGTGLVPAGVAQVMAELVAEGWAVERDGGWVAGPGVKKVKDTQGSLFG
jgi:hypothetical protein